MRRLHLRLYLAIVGTLLVFLGSIAVVWHIVSTPMGAVWGVESATYMSANLMKNAHDRAAEQRIVDALAGQLHADVAVLGGDGAPAGPSHGHAFDSLQARRNFEGWQLQRQPTFGVRLEDGRMLAVHPRHRFLLHGLHVVLILTAVAAVLALLTYPIARGITARLGRLQQGVLNFGAGDLTARVAVEGHDEVAALANSFNDSAARVEQLVRANQMLLANCSHELRTPLARLRLAAERVGGGDRGALAELTRNIGELDVLIGELLLSSRLDVARQLERKEPVELLALAAEEAAHFDREASGEPVTVQGDPLLLRRLVRNLLENARAHAGGASEIQVNPVGATAQLVVEDHGPGIPPEDREKIFEPFYRRESSGSTGAGLGLSIVRQIARMHGGEVAYSPREASGSRFVVTLPAG
ncbi:MAG TPA: HAMP domain-containing sensor histidine kinase [Steroidobacteraceae bacterium]|nr:HAMP domain-containing sensor histidine kinase [Steroidobacteraceae bacterium]